MLATFGVARDATQFDSSIYSGSESLVKQGEGTLVLSAANTHSGGTVVEQGTLVVRNPAALGSGVVEVRSGAKLVLDGGGSTFEISSLALDPGGLIDVGTSKLSICTGFSRDALLSAIKAAKRDGSWNGTSGIGSSVVEAMAAEGTRRTLGWLGWVDHGDASFTVGFAATGDSNLDGCVDVMDLGNIFQQMDGDPAEAVTWNAGDFNHDDMVDIVDFAELFEVGLFGEGSYLPAPPPAAPGNVQATPVSTTSVMLSWTATDTPVGYEIERSADGVGDWRPVASGAMQISGTLATIGGLQPGERAYFRLRAFAESPSWWWDDRYRSADTATVAATAIPSAPVAVTARGVTPTQAVISWVPGPGRSTGTVVQRQQAGDSVSSQLGTPVQRQAAGDAAWVEVSTVAPNLQFVIDTGVEPGQTYTYRVQSVSDGVSSVAVSPGGSATMPTEDPPSDSDQDGDGVPDVVELIAGSNPDASDSDGDGVGDYSEIQQGSDPLVREDRGQKPTAPANPPDWWSFIDLNTGGQVKATGVVMLPADVSLPAPILLVWRAFDPFTVNGTTFNAGRSYYDRKGLSEGRDLITVSSRWFTIDLYNPKADGRPMGDVMFEYLSIDIDVDSDNNNHLQPPVRSLKEEQIEESSPKKVIVNSAYNDDDKIPDYADWWIAGKSFTPVVVQIPDAIPVTEMTVTFDYAASDPSAVSVIAPYGLPENGGPIRLWTKNASDVRSPLSVAQNLDPSGGRRPGDFVKPGVEYDASALGFSQSARTIVFYVEGVRLSKDPNPIKIEVKANGMVLGKDTVTVSVISNFLVIGIDGTDQSKWLNGPNATRPNGLWNSHVRNLLDDVDPYAMTIYNIGPTQAGFDCAEIQTSVVNEANRYIEEAGGDTIVALVGWSRGAMIALWAANDLVGMPGRPQPSKARQVAFVGLYDPVDMSTEIPSDDHAGRIQPGVGRVTIVGAAESPNNNVDWPVGWPSGWNDIPFWRMAQTSDITGEFRITPSGDATVVERYSYNASHGSIGGTPGFSRHLVSIPDGAYDYVLDRERSILSDKNIRDGMRASGFSFVPDRTEDWYGIPTDRPVIAPDN